jgi:undecaprenyl diphosphate synthase
VDAIMDLLRQYLRESLSDFQNENIRTRFIGDRAPLAEDIRQLMEEAEATTAHKTGMQLNIAISYGGRLEIVDAAKAIATQVQAGTLKIEDIDENVFAKNLYLKGAPDPDLVIRTGGEFRLSNYLLWQAAYSEFYVTDTLWPDFTKEEFLKAVEFFKTRERRFGKVLHE